MTPEDLLTPKQNLKFSQKNPSNDDHWVISSGRQLK
jgi:hypothetical protein